MCLKSAETQELTFDNIYYSLLKAKGTYADTLACVCMCVCDTLVCMHDTITQQGNDSLQWASLVGILIRYESSNPRFAVVWLYNIFI